MKYRKIKAWASLYKGNINGYKQDAMLEIFRCKKDAENSNKKCWGGTDKVVPCEIIIK